MRISLRPSQSHGKSLSSSLNVLSRYLALTPILLTTFVGAVAFNPVPSPNLDLDSLGRVALAGDFEGISLYQFEGQNENGFSTNGSQSVLSRFPNGGFATLASADAGIHAMCSFTMQDGTDGGVIVGGNFTSLGGIESQGVAMFNSTTGSITPLSGLSGQVSALLCDKDTNTVYVGGSFIGANSTNAIAWVGTAGWTNLPFAGFNGPVTSISKASNGHIIFGGTFTGLGNATGPNLPDQQIINISTSNVTSGSSSSTAGFSDPRNIICKTDGTDGAGNTWLLADNTPGFWDASFGFGFQPTKLRLWNTRQDGRGAKTWRFTAHPINGIMNLTYIDPVTKENASCSSECPLSNDPNIKFQDFHFVNVIGMSGFRVDISDWYGSGGGLNGIELFQDDIYSYAIPSFNEPNCTSIDFASTSTPTGPWTVTPSRQSLSQYLSANVTDADTTSVVFLPDIKQSGNYSVNMYTPGCLQDDSCGKRGRVNITGIMATGASSAGFTTEIFQTNNFDKYDQIYFGFIEAGTGSFRPSVTLSPIAGQNIPDYSIVAQRVGFTLISSSGGLNNLFEYDTTQIVIDTIDLDNSTFNKAGVALGTASEVNTLVTSGSTTFVGGNFTTSTFNNIFAIVASEASPLTGSGLNGEVKTLFLNGSTLYVGGKFTNTTTGGIAGLNNVAAYDTSSNAWTALGAGVNGVVKSAVPLTLNITANTPETVITFTGNFDQVQAFGTNKATSVNGFAIWVPSQENWLQNLGGGTMRIDGVLTASVDLPGGDSLFAGSLSSSQLLANGAVSLTSAGNLNSLPIQIQSSQSQSQSSLAKRAGSAQNVSGVVTGLFYEEGDRNLTILGGHFTATGSNGSDVNNLAFIDGSNNDTVTGVGSDLSNASTFKSLAVQGTTLYAGGSVTGTVNGINVNGIISYNLAAPSFSNQPPALAGDSVSVNAITIKPDSSDVYVGGSFLQAGSLDCPAVCVYTTSASQWNRPGSNLGGSVSVMAWASSSSLIVGGELSVNGANVPLATYDAKTQTWAVAAGAETIPGPVAALAAANNDASDLWIAGTASNGSSYLMKSTSGTWNTVGDVFGTGSVIRGLQVLSLSKNHNETGLVSKDETLMITGALVLPGFGNASSALYNGATFTPFALTSSSSNTGGSLSQIVSQKQVTFNKKGAGMKIGFIILIGLAIALGGVFLIVLGGLFIERLRKKRRGYIPVPTSTYDRGAAMTRLPPSQLFSSIGQSRSGIEKQGTRI
ncbi:cortical protein marker for cell polarity-domain-containing protein [Bisporella sp. PMI_857]|nr:cortical protein marker for cell polarity-domain-containing protein [Bisporella sp. PMI_857]